VNDEAEERKHGGRTGKKHAGKVHGDMKHHAGRKRGARAACVGFVGFESVHVCASRHSAEGPQTWESS
jgi:hypothetical protein